MNLLTSPGRNVALAALALFLLGVNALAQPAPANGPKRVDPRWHALTHATLIPTPGKVIEDATIVMRDGVIVSVSPGGAPPAGAREWDCTGLFVFAGFIEPYAPVEAPLRDENAAGAHWNNKRIQAHRSALDGDGLDEATRKKLRGLGYAAAAITPDKGIFRGSAALVSLAEPESATAAATPEVIVPNVYQSVAFETSGWGSGEYPGSLMGAIALIRQTLLDAGWNDQIARTASRTAKASSVPVRSESLAALGPNSEESTQLLFHAKSEVNVLRASKIANEFSRRSLIVGNGMDFRRLEAIATDRTRLIAPVTYPKAPKVSTYGERESVTLRDLQSWEQAPTNLRRLRKEGVQVAITTDQLRKDENFHANIRKAIEQGLSEDDALAMLTTTPAMMLGASEILGRVDDGMLANLVVLDGELFDKETKIRDVWVSGRRFEINEAPDNRFEGVWAARFGDAEPIDGKIEIGEGDALKLAAIDESSKAKSVTVRASRIDFTIDGEAFDAEGVWTLSGVLADDQILGTVVDPGGFTFPWRAERTDEPFEIATADEDEGDESASEEIGDDSESGDEMMSEDDEPELAPELVVTPVGAYGLAKTPESEDMLLTGGVIWTSGPDGIIENGAMLVEDGRVSWVGPASEAPRRNDIPKIELGGMHVTPGLIDCHSHIAITGGVNEGTQAVTSEVRIGDVVNPDDINLYRQLAGGLTAANLLHGSANPIGGQNQTIKLRWGSRHPDDMKVKGAMGGIKFALGENVKQANWGDKYTTRYPQTRLGVETIIRDRFIAADEYARAKAQYEGLSASEQRRSIAPRVDLELEALAEVLANRRLVHCHSYRQDEILMLCRVATEFGFRIGTFQHVLEGYKVAEAIKEAAIGGSSFSDWWAYKMEVIDAIPENGAIMHEVGVVVSFNSDSAELARRMNTEAAKAVRYGNVPPEEALKFVTINPAIQLGVEDRIGSLEPGKDADFAIWSGSPLSTMSRCEATYIDGARYFSRERDLEMRDEARAERSRIIQKILASGAGGKGGSAPVGRAAALHDHGHDHHGHNHQGHGHELDNEALEAYMLDLLRAGIDPEANQCGDCGCVLFEFSR